jgi:hypothetical protein
MSNGNAGPRSVILGGLVFLTVALVVWPALPRSLSEPLVVLGALSLLIWIAVRVVRNCLRILKRTLRDLERAWRAGAKRAQERLAEEVRELPFALSRSPLPLMPSGTETFYCPIPPVEHRKMKHKFLVLWASALVVCGSAYATYPGTKSKENWLDAYPTVGVQGSARVVDGTFSSKWHRGQAGAPRNYRLFFVGLRFYRRAHPWS